MRYVSRFDTFVSSSQRPLWRKLVILGAVLLATFLALTMGQGDHMPDATHAEGNGDGGGDTDAVRLAQYNVQFLLPNVAPDFLLDSLAFFPATKERANQVGLALACMDIVVLNETSNNTRREDVFNAMEANAADCPGLDGDPPRPPLVPNGRGGVRFFDFVDGPDNSQTDPILDDEVAIASRYPIIEVHTTVYDECSGIDCLADKGVIHARVWRGPGHPASDSLDLFATHLDANEAVAQLPQLAAFVGAHNDSDTPALIMGDFNIGGNQEHIDDPGSGYNSMISTLSASLGGDLVDAGGTVFTDPEQDDRLDYIFVSGAGTRDPDVDCFEAFNTPSLQADIKSFVEEGLNHGGISDHCGVLTTLDWVQPAVVPNPGAKLPRILQVEVSRLEEVTLDVPTGVFLPVPIIVPTPGGPITFFILLLVACDGLTDHFGDLSLTADGLKAHRNFDEDHVFEGDDITPVPPWKARLAIPAGVAASIVNFNLEDDDDLLCGGSNDTQDINPYSDAEAITLVVDSSTDEVFAAKGNSRIRLASIGEAVILLGTDDVDRARVTLIVTEEFVNEADLRVQKFCKPDEVAGPGQPFECTILVDNQGPGLAREVVVKDMVITDVDDFVIGTPTFIIKDGTGDPKGCEVTSQSQFECELGTLPVNGTAVITASVVSNEGGQFNNVAQVQTKTPDPDLTNNKAVVSGITVRTCKLGVSTTELVPPAVAAVNILPEPGLEGKPVAFGAPATDNCNSPGELHYKWTFSDGGIGFGSGPQHTFADNGFYTGTVHVSDKAGNEAQRDFRLVIENQPPVISPLPVPPKTPWGVPIEFSGQATDPGEADKANLRYHWDFDDGTSALNQKVTHAFPAPGIYHVTLTVTDDKDSATAVVDVIINKRPTTIKNCGETQVEESAHKVSLCARLLVADLDGGDLDAGVKGKTLSFSLAQNKIVSGDTDANGESRPSVNLVLSAGCIPGVISFVGDDLYEPFTYEYVYYTIGGGRPGSPAGQVCELNETSSGFQLLDSDGDGCSNGQEAGTSASLGGLRDQGNAYDFFDVPVGTGDDSRKDKAVNTSDIVAIVARFGATGDASGALFLGPIPQGRTYHPAFDRTLLGPELWNLGPPDGRIDVTDIALAITQFGHTCA